MPGRERERERERICFEKVSERDATGELVRDDSQRVQQVSLCEPANERASAPNAQAVSALYKLIINYSIYGSMFIGTRTRVQHYSSSD